MRIKIAAIAAATFALTLTGCGLNDSVRDYEEGEVVDPESATLWNNVDGHPNVVRLCTDGVAWATTTRDYTAIIRVPEWDKHCKDVGTRKSKNTD